MHLASMRIRDYRSVHDSGDVEIEPAKTLLVGVNEAGKTALLRALQQINAPSDVDGFMPLRDYPRASYSEVQRGNVDPSNVVVAEARFVLTDSERETILEHSPASAEVVHYVRYRYMDNTNRWSFGDAKLWASFREIGGDLVRLRAHISKQDDSSSVVTALDSLISGCKPNTAVRGALAKGLSAWLATAYPLVMEGDETEESRHARLVDAVDLAGNVVAAHLAMERKLPLFVYYSTYFTVRPRINLASLAAREQAGDIDQEYDFGNLCLLKLLGLTAKELSELASGEPQLANYAGGGTSQEYLDASKIFQDKLDDRQYRLNAASVELTKSIREVWGDEHVQLRLVPDGQYLKVVVVDDLGVEVELDQRSEGFRWLVSFFVVFKAQASGALKNSILLLDEPGLSLHALKQQEFRKTVSRLAQDNQVIYTTHSPFMVGTDELDLVRIVEMTDREAGTKVHTRLVVDDPRSVYPLQLALGYELAQSLFGQSRNLVCEGLTDMMYVEALSTALGDTAGGLKTGIALVPASSASKVIYYSTLLASQNLKVAALLDSDQAGNDAAKQDELVALLTTKRILRTKDYCDSSVSRPEVEDLLRTTLIMVAKDDLGWDVVDLAATQPGRPLCDMLKKECPSFSKYKLARAFIRWLAANEVSALQPVEQSQVAALFKDINKALR